MPDKPEIKITLDVTADCDAVLEQYCANFLKERGWYIVAPSEPWEKAGAFCRRVKVNPSKLQEIISRYEVRTRNSVKLDRRGVSKRIMTIQRNPEFEAFCLSLSRGGE